jgi:hypothetical protein
VARVPNPTGRLDENVQNARVSLERELADAEEPHEGHNFSSNIGHYMDRNLGRVHGAESTHSA